MSLPWFRVYGEMVDDGKLKLLAFEDRWHYVALLCCKTQGIQDSTRDDLLDAVIAAKLGLAARDADEVRKRLIRVDLIDKRWQPTGWEKRQRRADDTASRMRNYRERKKSASEEEKNLEEDTDTEACVTGYVTVTQHETLPADTWQEWIEHRKRRRWPCDPTTLRKQLKLLSAYDTETQRQILDTSINAGWQGLFAPKGQQPRRTRYEELMSQRKPSAPTAASQFLLGADHDPQAN